MSTLAPAAMVGLETRPTASSRSSRVSSKVLMPHSVSSTRLLDKYGVA